MESYNKKLLKLSMRFNIIMAILILGMPAWAVEFPYEVPGTIDDPYSDTDLICTIILPSKKPHEEQYEVGLLDDQNSNFVRYHARCKEQEPENDWMRFGFEIDCKNKQILGIDGDLVTYEFGWWAGETDRSLGGGDGRYATTVSSAYHKNGGTYTLQYANYLAYLNHSVYQPIYDAICSN